MRTSSALAVAAIGLWRVCQAIRFTEMLSAEAEAARPQDALLSRHTLAKIREHAGLYANKWAHPEHWNTILVTASNIAYADMLKNWRCQADKLGLDYLVIAFDPELLKVAGSKHTVLVGQAHFNEISCLKIRIVQQIIKMTGLNVVFSDPDNVFRRDPFSSSVSLGSKMLSGKYEYIYQQNHGRQNLPNRSDIGTEVGEGNTGFYFVSGSRKREGVQALFEAAITECKRHREMDDQTNFWMALTAIRNHTGRQRYGPGNFACANFCGNGKTCGAPDREVLGYCEMDPFIHATGWEIREHPDQQTKAEPEATELEDLDGELGSPGPQELRSLQAELDDLEGEFPPDAEELQSLQNDTHVGISGRVKTSSSMEECGSQVILNWLGYDHFNYTEKPLDDPLDGTAELLRVDMLKQRRHAPVLDGRQWCGAARMRRGRVALVLWGEAFRARNFLKRSKYDCSRASVEVQRRLANNHLNKIVTPIEWELGMKVDIYLTIAGCSYLSSRDVSQNVTPSFHVTKTLVKFYGKSHVKGLLGGFRSKASMYERLADVHVKLDAAMANARSGVYDYFIMIRYDVYLDRKFTDLVPKPATGHHRLSFYMSAHDFAWSFPGEMWNCMREFWDGCMRKTNHSSLNTVDWGTRERLSCFQLGPVSTPRWAQGYAFDQALTAIGKGANWRGAKPAVALHRTGCSGFNVRGDELRCTTGWFWPPRSHWEDRFMPHYYHIG